MKLKQQRFFTMWFKKDKRKDKNSLFESGSSKKSRLTGLCDVWGWVTTCWAADDAAPSPNRLYPIKTPIQDEDCNVNAAIG